MQTSSAVLVLSSLLPTISLCIIFQAMPTLSVALADFAQLLSPALPPSIAAGQPTASHVLVTASASCATVCFTTTC